MRDSVPKTSRYDPLLVALIAGALVATGAILTATALSGLYRESEFWKGVLGNLNASIIDFLLVSIVATLVYKQLDKARWSHTSDFVHARLLDEVVSAWNTLEGGDLSRPLLRHHFGGFVSDPAPDVKGIEAMELFSVGSHIAKNLDDHLRYASESFQEHVDGLSSGVDRSSMKLEHMLISYGSHLKPSVWESLLLATEKLRYLKRLLLPTKEDYEWRISIFATDALEALQGAIVHIAEEASLLETDQVYEVRIQEEAMRLSKQIEVDRNASGSEFQNR